MSAWGDIDEYKTASESCKCECHFERKFHEDGELCWHTFNKCEHCQPDTKECKCREIDFNEPGIYDKSDCPIHTDTKAQDWEKELANMIYDYNRNTDGLLFIEAKFHNKLEDFISNAIEEERERVLKEVNDQYVDMFGFDEDLDKYLGKIVEELEAKK